jgi:hypothetical protein
LTDPIEYKIKEGRALHWLNVGAQPSNAVARLLKKQGTYDRLSRLRDGEEMHKLISEFEGIDPVLGSAEVDAEVVAAVETVVAVEEEE